MLFSKIAAIASLAVLPFAMANGYEESYGHGQEYVAPKHESYPSPKHEYKHDYEPHYPPQPYKFGYDVKDGYGGNLNQKEEGDSYGNKKGSYGYTDPYGVYRYVEYVADKNGFRASIKTNEPGTASQNPADVYMNADPVQTHYEPSHYKAAASSSPKTYKAPTPKADYPASIYSMPAYAEY